MTENKPRTTSPKNSRRFPVWIIISIGLILAAGAIIFLVNKNGGGFQPAVSGAPKLKILRIVSGSDTVVDGDKVDFGDVKVGDPVKVSYTLTNVGDQPLEFKEPPWIEVKEGC
jgi:hypothetical protein